MSSSLNRIKKLAASGDVRISSHGYDELAEDGIIAREIVDGVELAELVENYPDYPKGPCVLVLQHDAQKQAIHVVWGILRGKHSPAVLMTAYRPDANRWSNDFLRRKL